ncbi:hypothetical protein NQ317_007811 [Molorchus minor]|uniref:Uncharacterized protein n=1 Tax=Molorchus minor TaxID=1323400 RepID=A0ABQ9IR68_9CUCU|nr:hypothetical protein NQ317_007811 [Molorchus minor]
MIKEIGSFPKDQQKTEYGYAFEGLEVINCYLILPTPMFKVGLILGIAGACRCKLFLDCKNSKH